MIELKSLSDNEKKCLRLLSKLFLAGETDQRQGFQDELKTAGADLQDHRQFRVVLEMMQEYGAIKAQPIHEGDGKGGMRWFVRFEIAARAVVIARELDNFEEQEKEPKDIVEYVNNKLRSHKIAALVILVFFVLTAILTFCNQAVQLFGPLSSKEPKPIIIQLPPPDASKPGGGLSWKP